MTKIIDSELTQPFLKCKGQNLIWNVMKSQTILMFQVGRKFDIIIISFHSALAIKNADNHILKKWGRGGERGWSPVSSLRRFFFFLQCAQVSSLLNCFTIVNSERLRNALMTIIVQRNENRMIFGNNGHVMISLNDMCVQKPWLLCDLNDVYIFRNNLLFANELDNIMQIL